jgi:ethanolamine utilization protein EutM
MSESIGTIETRGYVASIEAADAMSKAASVELVKQVQIGAGYVTIIAKGDVGSVKAAVEAGEAAAAKVGEVVSSNIIARPHPELLKQFGF